MGTSYGSRLTKPEYVYAGKTGTSQIRTISAEERKLELKNKDRVAAYVPNAVETITSFLASSKNGLIWSSCSPDFGSQGVVDRFLQIKPKILITSDYYFYNGKKINILEKIPEILKKIKSIKKVIIFPYSGQFQNKINPK